MQHWQYGAKKSTSKLFLQLVLAKCCCLLNEILVSQNNYVFCKRSTMFDTLFNAFYNLFRDYILLYTLKMIMAFVFNAIPQHSNECVQTNNAEHFHRNVMSYQSCFNFIPSEISFDMFTYNCCRGCYYLTHHLQMESSKSSTSFNWTEVKYAFFFQ